MREKLTFLEGKSMWRWLLLALLLTSIVSHHFAEPKSIYRIEEVISNGSKESHLRKTGTFSYAFKSTDKRKCSPKSLSLQFGRLRFLSQSLQIHTALAVFNAPDLLPILMNATGQQLNRKSQSSEEPFPFHS
ncbi:hypothetical protein [Dyadobacter alkalitolerans]|uniref:hypothetical protein n=1 Tax=Dyadobacter alkalitolerans TaxID=492736 RepID=UPI0004085E63|nr:hypothetical protein [Dyadobacter alkalitolerans]